MAVRTPIYLDHNASTPIDPRVLERLHQVQRDHFGNASANHAFGWAAAKLVEQAREQVAASIGATPREIVFTSGATESNNLALIGTVRAYGHKRPGLVSSTLEHPSVDEPLAFLAQRGWTLTRVLCGEEGVVAAADFGDALTADTLLVSLIAAQNEIGTLQPVAAVGRLCKERGVLLHCDAVQAVGKVPFDVQEVGADLVSLSSHKLYGPQGVGALYVRRRDPRVALEPLLHGGGHERGLRSGTINVPGVVAFGEACELAVAGMADEAVRLGELSRTLWRTLRTELPDIHLNGCPERRLPGNLNISFAGLESGRLLASLSALAVSTGSACSSTDTRPSSILTAIGRSEELARSSLRIGLGRGTTAGEVEFAARTIIDAVRRLRGI